MRTPPPAKLWVSETHAKLQWALQMTGELRAAISLVPSASETLPGRSSGGAAAAPPGTPTFTKPSAETTSELLAGERKEDGSYIRLAHKTDLGKKLHTPVYTPVTKKESAVSVFWCYVNATKSSGDYPKHPGRHSWSIMGVDTVRQVNRDSACCCFFSAGSVADQHW